jgi:mannose-6-phosphate isomerase-like protein (cupin superfamily)
LVLQKKNFQKPDEIQTPPNSRVDTIRIEGMTVQKQTYQPGWQWSKHMKSIAGTKSCQVHHFGVLVSGRLHVKADDGQEIELGPGDVVDIPPGHDGWVIGNEPATFYWFQGKTNPK